MADLKQSMMAFLAKRSPGAAANQKAGNALTRIAPTALMVLLIALAGWLAADWYWYFEGASGPRAPVQPTRVDVASAAQTIAAAQPFGANIAPTVASAQAAAISTLNIKLKGVFAHDSKTAVAIFNNGQKDDFAKVGSEVAPGVVLDSVHPTHVLLKRGGALERVNLEERVGGGAGRPPLMSRQAPPPPPMIAPPPSVPQNVPQPGPPPGIPGMNPALNPGMNPGLPPTGVPPGISQPQSGSPTANQFGRLATSRAGVRVEAAPPGSILERIGLQSGDVIRTVNGQSIASEGDLARIYQQTAPGSAVMAEVSRAGKVVPLQVTR